jgi:hypothetical protein
LIIHFGVISLFSSIFLNFNTFRPLFQTPLEIDVKLNCKNAVFELLPKTCNLTICSILSNSGHVGWCTASLDKVLKLETLVMIQTKFGFHWSSTFRGEDF